MTHTHTRVLACSKLVARSLSEALAPSDMSESTVLRSSNVSPCNTPSFSNSSMYFWPAVAICCSSRRPRGMVGRTDDGSSDSVTILFPASPAVTEKWLLKSSSTAERTVSSVCAKRWWHLNSCASSRACSSTRLSGGLTEQETNARRRSGEGVLPQGKEEIAKQTPGGMSGLRLSVSPSHGSEEALVRRACCVCWSRVDAVCRTAGGRQCTDCSSNQQPV